MSTTAPPTSAPSAPSTPPLWTDPQRQRLFEAWCASVQATWQLDLRSLRLASADASFRRYLRVDTPQGSLVVMDAPPALENCQPFVHVARLMAEAGLHAPKVLSWDEAHGFMLLTDLGSQTLLQAMDPQAPPPLGRYLEAVDMLVQWQLASHPGVLPPYDRALLLRELELFPQWYMGEYRRMPPDTTQRTTLDKAFATIIENNLEWPSVYVHRDFMPRNLMLGSDGRLGILDFQDAVFGPITYDIASLMRDAFISWEEEFCLDVTIRYWEKARKANLPVGSDFGAFYRAVEWMGLQRHLKVAGIFARLSLRDGKPQYLADTPRFITYLHATCTRYIELKPLLRLIEQVEGMQGVASRSGFAFGRV